MNEIKDPGLAWALQRRPREVCGYQLEPTSWLHQMFLKRMETDRDLKIIITAKDAQTGVGKSTLAFALAAAWHPIYAREEWTAEEYATYDVSAYLEKYRNVQSGSVLMMEEAEQLDSRRSMASDNVDFSHFWMAMRVRQVVSILTLPSTTALDKRLWELADVWINVTRRGAAEVHECQINEYKQRLWREPIETQEWPDVSDHPEMKAIDQKKEDKIDRGLDDIEAQEEADNIDPEAAKREQLIEVAQRLRESDEHDLSGKEIGEIVGRSHTWVYNNTEPAKSARKKEA